VFALVPLSARWSFQPEVKFDHRNITISDVPSLVNYVTVPLLLRNTIGGFYMLQGASINILTSASVFGVDFKDVYTSPDVAIVIGGGKRAGPVSIDGRWESGLRSFQKDVSSGVHLRTFTATVSYHIK
jgi:hypothetical protein